MKQRGKGEVSARKAPSLRFLGRGRPRRAICRCRRLIPAPVFEDALHTSSFRQPWTY